MMYVRSIFLSLAVLLGLISTLAAQDAPMQIEGARTVDARQIFDLFKSKPNLVILDNRKEEDYAAGHIEGAIRLLDTEVSPDSLAKHISAKDTPVLFYCNGVKCGRAAKAIEKAVQLGYTNVYYYALGMQEWNGEGLPVVK
jgi:rhodanese-related sulfurtransferase